jgi:hypothetical protein
MILFPNLSKPDQQDKAGRPAHKKEIACKGLTTIYEISHHQHCLALVYYVEWL